MRVALWSCLVSSACLSQTPEPPAPPGPRQLHIALTPQVYHLMNGLTAILVPDPSADLASVRVNQHVGAVDDPLDHPGLAHLAAHLSYATLTGPLTRWDQLDRLATGIEMTPATTETSFVEQVDTARLIEVLRIEGQRLSAHCDAGTPHWFPWLRDQVTAEVRAATSWTVNRDFHHTVYSASDPQYRAFDATPDTIAAIGDADACAFLDRYYVPANATILVSGPIDAATFEHAIKAELEPVPGGTANPARPASALVGSSTDTTITADVNEPTLAITYALPDDRGQRAVMTFALELLAVKVDAASILIEDDLATVWFPEHVADAATALSKITAALQTGLVDPTEFEATRTRRVTELLGRLDATSTRLELVAEGVDLDAPFVALDAVSPQGFDRFVAARIALAHARILRMLPNGTRPKWRPTWISAPGHRLIGPSSFVANDQPGFVAARSRALTAARTVKLANGMTAILMPTSPIPIMDVRLAFNVGAAAEPEAHRGTASIAVSAIDEMAARTHADTRWSVGTHTAGADLDTSGVVLRGPSLDSDLLIGQFDGLAGAKLEAADVQKGRDQVAEAVHSPMQHLWMQSTTMRAATYGANHPYARAKPPGQPDVDGFDLKEVEAFTRTYLQPNNATLIVTGGFDPNLIEPMVHRTFDGWHGTGDATPAQPAHLTAATYAADETRATVTFHATWQGSVLDDHYEARVLLANVLGAISSDVHSSYHQRRQGGTYELDGVFDLTKAAQQIADVVKTIPDVASGNRRYTVAFESARLRQSRWMSSAPSSAGAGAGIVFGLENRRDVAWLANMPRRIAAVTYAEMAQLARTELTLDHAIIVISGPHDAVVAVYAALGITPTWLN